MNIATAAVLFAMLLATMMRGPNKPAWRWIAAGLGLLLIGVLAALARDPRLLGDAPSGGTEDFLFLVERGVGYLGGAVALAVGLVALMRDRGKTVPAARSAEHPGDDPLWDHETLAAMLEEAVENLSEAFALYDDQDRLVVMNSRYREYYREHAASLIVGRTFEEMLREGVSNGQFVEAVGCEEEWIAQRVHSHQNPSDSIDQRLPDGRWVRVSEAKTKSGYVVGLRVDISEIKRAEAALRDSEAQFRAFMDNLPAAASMSDLDGTYHIANKTFASWYRLDPSAIEGANISNVFPGETAARYVDRHRDVVRTGQASQREVTNTMPDGETRTTVALRFPIADETGRISKLGFFEMDVTDLHQARAEQRRQEAVLTSMIENSPAIMSVRELDGSYSYVSPSLAKFLGRPVEELLGRNAMDFWPRHMFDQFRKTDKRIVETGKAMVGDAAPTFEMNGRTILMHKFPIKDQDGRVARTGIAGLDITDLRRAELASAAKTEFLSSMSHELRTPLNAILGFAQLLETDPEAPLTTAQTRAVNHILAGGNHLLELINQVLDLQKIEAGETRIDFENASSRHVIAQGIDLIRVKAEDDGINVIDHSTTKQLPEVRTDVTRLRQVLFNLLSNAVKYNKPGGSVVLDAEENDDMLRITISDTGIGIPLEARDKLFRPFERLGQERGKIEGTGIGLTITKQIIDLLGGRIGFESTHGEGSTFWIEVPIATESVEVEAD